MKVLEKEFPPNTKKKSRRRRFVIILFRAYTTMKEEKEAKGECRTTRHMDVVVVPGGRRCRSEGEKGKEEEERDTHCIRTGWGNWELGRQRWNTAESLCCTRSGQSVGGLVPQSVNNRPTVRSPSPVSHSSLYLISPCRVVSLLLME